MQQAAAIKLTPKHQRACGRMITVATKIDPTPGKVKLIKKTVYAVPKSTTPRVVDALLRSLCLKSTVLCPKRCSWGPQRKRFIIYRTCLTLCASSRSDF